MGSEDPLLHVQRVISRPKNYGPVIFKIANHKHLHYITIVRICVYRRAMITTRRQIFGERSCLPDFRHGPVRPVAAYATRNERGDVRDMALCPYSNATDEHVHRDRYLKSPRVLAQIVVKKC